MGSYERLTATPVHTALEEADSFLRTRIPIQKVGEDSHSVTLSGGDGKVVITAHRHGPDTLVTAVTDQVRTSRLDGEVQHYMNKLPYQPGDVPRL